MTSEGSNDERPDPEYAQDDTQPGGSNEEYTRVTKLNAEYQQVNENFRMLADIRFKLLALIPVLGGVAIFLLSGLQQVEEESQLGYGLLLLISGLGFLATLGVTFYDQRNSELYNALIRLAGLSTSRRS